MHWTEFGWSLVSACPSFLAYLLLRLIDQSWRTLQTWIYTRNHRLFEIVINKLDFRLWFLESKFHFLNTSKSDRILNQTSKIKVCSSEPVKISFVCEESRWTQKLWKKGSNVTSVYNFTNKSLTYGILLSLPGFWNDTRVLKLLLYRPYQN